MKNKDKILTYEQAKELKFFCKSVVGTRQEFYKLLDEMNAFKIKLDRLDKTCWLIGDHLSEEIKAFEKVWTDMKNDNHKPGL